MDAGRERTLYITNLHDDVTEELLYELFTQAGPVAYVSMKRTTYPFAFVEFKHEESVPYALALLNGVALFDKPLNIRARDGTEMEKKISAALSTARNMHAKEQLAALQQMQHQQQYRWPLPSQPSPQHFQIQQQLLYTQMAVAQMHNPISRTAAPFMSPQQTPMFAHPQPLFYDARILQQQTMSFRQNVGGGSGDSRGSDYHQRSHQSRERERHHRASGDYDGGGHHGMHRNQTGTYFDDRSRSRSNHRDRDNRSNYYR